MSAVGSAGDRVIVDGSYGTIRYAGLIDGDPMQQMWYGIEWDEIGRGKNDGSARGRRYFECAENQGSFVKAHLCIVEKDFMDAVSDRYIRPFVADHDFMITDPKTNKQKKVEFVGSAKAEEFFKMFQRLAYMTLSDSSICKVEKMPLMPLACRHLSLDGNDFQSWGQIIKVLRFSPWVSTLTLSRNPIGKLDIDIAAWTNVDEDDLPFVGVARQTIADETRTPQERAAAADVLATFDKVVFPNVKVLTLNYCPNAKLIETLEICATLFPNIMEIHLAKTGIDADEVDIVRLREFAARAASAPDAPLSQLRGLDLEDCAVLRWSFLAELAAFPNLVSLQLNGCTAPKADGAVLDQAYLDTEVPYTLELDASSMNLPAPQVPEGLLGLNQEQLQRFSKITELFLESAPIGSWRTWGELALVCPKLTSLRASDTLAAAEAGRKSRQLIIALFPELRLLNSSDVSGRERSQSELYFLSLLRDAPSRPACALCRAADVNNCHALRLLRLHVEALLPPSQGGLNANGGEQVSERVIAVTLDAQQAVGAQVVRRKLLPTTTLEEVKLQVERLFNVKREVCKLHLKEPGAPCLVELTDDKRDLEYFGVTSGSTLVVEDAGQTAQEEEQFAAKQAAKKTAPRAEPAAPAPGGCHSCACGH